MRMFIAGGGTGGHLYPGLAIARALQRVSPGVSPFFIGAQRGIERNVLPDSGMPYELLDLHPLYRARPWENWKTLRGAFSAWRRIGEVASEERPACVVGTGGYASAIALAWGASHGIPCVLQEQNSFPGLTTRVFSRFARQVHTGYPEAALFLHPGKNTQVLDSGNPIEPPPAAKPDPRKAKESWGFPADAPVLLVYGGSQGSKAINDTVAAWVNAGIPGDLRVIWATGRGTYESYAALDNPQVCVRPYLAPVTEAYAATDFAVSRAGAIATAELCAWGIPPIVIPLPTAAADHQTANAKALSEAGAAEFIPQSALTVERLDAAVRRLLDDPSLLQSRARTAAARARPNAADDIARHILDLVARSAA